MDPTIEEYRANLQGMIDALVSGAWSVKEFDEQYYWYWLNGMPHDLLSDDEVEFYSLIQEQLEWTAAAPSEEERGYGWLTEVEFVDWVRLHRIGFDSPPRV